MNKQENLELELHTLCRFKALRTTRFVLCTTLFAMSLFLLRQQRNAISFYICMILFVFPPCIESSLTKIKEYNMRLSYVKYKLQYSRKRYYSLLASYYISLGLLFIWELTLLADPSPNKLLAYFPAILIIASLLIYTIGQYYYFIKYQSNIMENNYDEIH